MTARILLAAALLAAGCMPRYISEDRTDRREKELRIQQKEG